MRAELDSRGLRGVVTSSSGDLGNFQLNSLLGKLEAEISKGLRCGPIHYGKALTVGVDNLFNQRSGNGLWNVGAFKETQDGKRRRIRGE